MAPRPTRQRLHPHRRRHRHALLGRPGGSQLRRPLDRPDHGGHRLRDRVGKLHANEGLQRHLHQPAHRRHHRPSRPSRRSRRRTPTTAPARPRIPTRGPRPTSRPRPTPTRATSATDDNTDSFIEDDGSTESFTDQGSVTTTTTSDLRHQQHRQHLAHRQRLGFGLVLRPGYRHLLRHVELTACRRTETPTPPPNGTVPATPTATSRPTSKRRWEPPSRSRAVRRIPTAARTPTRRTTRGPTHRRMGRPTGWSRIRRPTHTRTPRARSDNYSDQSYDFENVASGVVVSASQQRQQHRQRQRFDLVV